MLLRNRIMCPCKSENIKFSAVESNDGTEIHFDGLVCNDCGKKWHPSAWENRKLQALHAMTKRRLTKGKADEVEQGPDGPGPSAA